MDENLVILRHQLLNGSYSPNPYRQILVPKSNGEKRTIYFPSPKDNLVMHAVLNIIGNVFESKFVEGNLGYRLALGEKENKSIYLGWQDSYQEYISKARSFIEYQVESFYHITDIRNFHPSVNVEILLQEKIAPFIADSRIMDLLYRLINTTSFNEDEESIAVKGLPSGAVIAPFLANVYLHELDRQMIQLTSGYIRYVDDICFICKNSASFEQSVEVLQQSLSNLQLQANAIKTKSEPITNPEPLVEHTKKMHYDQQFGFVNETKLQLSDRRQAIRTFSEMFLSAGSEGDVQTIARRLIYPPKN